MIIALLSDFGTVDPFVGIMKGVLASIAPQIRLVDLTHEIAPGDIQRGAYLLWQSARDLPPETIFLAVVDPGVGTDRKAILLEVGGRRFVGPDNGLFSYLTYRTDFQAFELTDPAYQLPQGSTTFHGRDIFAPAAAHAANGISSESFGPRLNSIQLLPQPLFHLKDNRLEAEILTSDRFGNLATSAGLFHRREGGLLKLDSWIGTGKTEITDPRTMIIQTAGRQLPLVRTFGSLNGENCGGVIGSTGLLELAANGGSAAEILGLGVGDSVQIQWKSN